MELQISSIKSPIKPTLNTHKRQSTRFAFAQDLLLLISILLLIWSCAFAPRLFAAPPDKPPAASEKTEPKPVQPTAPGQSTLININTADAATLAAGLNGIGLKKAEAIIAYREQKGKFTSLEQLLEVKGIGQATLDKNRSKLSL